MVAKDPREPQGALRSGGAGGFEFAAVHPEALRIADFLKHPLAARGEGGREFAGMACLQNTWSNVGATEKASQEQRHPGEHDGNGKHT